MVLVPGPRGIKILYQPLATNDSNGKWTVWTTPIPAYLSLSQGMRSTQGRKPSVRGMVFFAISCESASKIPIRVSYPNHDPCNQPIIPRSFLGLPCILFSSPSTHHGCHRTDGLHREQRKSRVLRSQLWRARLTLGNPTSFLRVLFMSQLSRNGPAQSVQLTLNQSNAPKVSWSDLLFGIVVRKLHDLRASTDGGRFSFNACM